MPEENDPSLRRPYGFWKCLGIGILLTIIGGTFYDDGELVEVLLFIGLSIYCTCGLALLAWIPAWYLAGLITVFPFRALRRPLESDNQRTREKKHPTSLKVIAVGNYIVQARDRGATDAYITEELELNGWKTSTIDQAFDYLRCKSGLDAGKGGGQAA